jgi:ABC-type oligopeptide transport system substrate-binding subunit
MVQKFDVFVSYSSPDKAIADAVVAAVEGEEIRCWYAPRDIEPGADWADSITQAIQECSMMVLVFSETANRSQRVIDEINYAIDRGKPILPFRIEPHTPTGALSLHLSSRHWLDAYEPSWDAHLDRLVDSVTANLESKTDTIQISGGAASAMVTEDRKPAPRKMTGYLIAGLAAITVLGLAGWQLLGGQAEPDPTEITTLAADIPTAVETSAADNSLPEETPTPEFSAVMDTSLIAPEDITTLDPHLADGATLEITKSLFLSLTRFNPETSVVEPAAAASWSVSPDGTIYTFTLHPDIPWVQHPLGGETVQVEDDEGNPRFLTAEDFEYAFRRICDPRIETYYVEILMNIAGCRDAWEYPDPENIPPEILNAVGVEAVSDTELIIRLIEPSASFLTRTTNPILVAVPSWAIEKYGEAWINPGIIPSSGHFVIDEWVSGEKIRMLRNQLLPVALQGGGNLGTVEITVVSSDEESYQLWLDEEIDYSEIPTELQQDHLEMYPDQSVAYNNQATYYAVFNHENMAFTDVHLRRAFSSALDRNKFLEEVINTGGIPMIHLAPPGVFGASPVDQNGIGYNPEFAQAELELAGYPGCEGMPPINFYAYSGIANTYGEEISRFWEDSLGCPEGTINFQGSLIDILYEEAEWDDWDLIITGWGSDFPDQDNWVGNLLSCEADNQLRSNRECSELDDLIAEARVETTPSDRSELYWELEEAFFGEEGSFPIAPLYTPYQYFAAKEWVTLVQPTSFEGFDMARSRLDMNAKLSELGD